MPRFTDDVAASGRFASGGHTARTRMPMRMSAIGMPSMRITMIVVSAPSRRIVPCT